MTLQPREAGAWKRELSLALAVWEAVQWPSALEMPDEVGSRDASVPCKRILLPNFGKLKRKVLDGRFGPSWGVKQGKRTRLQRGAGVAQGHGSGAVKASCAIGSSWHRDVSRDWVWMCWGVSSHVGVLEPPWLGWRLRPGGATPCPTRRGCRVWLSLLWPWGSSVSCHQSGFFVLAANWLRQVNP